MQPVPISATFGPHLRQPSTFSLSIASVRTQLSTRNKIVHIFYTASSRPPLSVSLTIFLSCPNPCSSDLWAPLTPTVNIFAEYCIGTHSTVHQKQNCLDFLYSIQPTTAQCLSHHLSLLSKSLLNIFNFKCTQLPSPASQTPACDIKHLSTPLSVSLTIFLSCPNRCSISSISNARQYLRFQMHVITHSLAHRPCLFQGALSGGRFIIQSPPPLPQLQLRDLQLHLICIPHQHLYYYPLPVKPPHVISNISPNPLSQTRIVRRRRLNRVYSAVSV